MSDFIFSRVQQQPGHLARTIRSIYQESPPEVFEFHGAWGSVAVSRNLHAGFQPLDTVTHLCVVIGGPVLTFTSNAFLTGRHETEGSRLLLERLGSGNGIQWDRDVSGPFAVLVIDKLSGEIQVITDMMSFIPAYRIEREGAIFLGTHVDMLARAAGCDTAVDGVSAAEYVLFGAVTFPHTLFQPVRQLEAASTSLWKPSSASEPMTTRYWVPAEENTFKSLDEAAVQLRAELVEYIDRVTEGMDRIACFVSGGEDSRAVLALLPRRCERDAFIFLDTFNREGRIAQRCAAAFGANFKPYTRSPSFYLDNFNAASRLMGSTWEPWQAHAYGFHVAADLVSYPAVFGGYLSDVLIKAHHVKKLKLDSIPFIPQIARPRLAPASAGLRTLFPKSILKAVRERRQRHYERIRRIRPRSASEWLTLWPMSMRTTMAYFHASRRLIRAYEPFMAAGVLKVAAACPQKWKLNRRLFQRAAQPALEPVKWLPHSDGRLPYFPWTNMMVHAAGWVAKTIELRRSQADQGAWTSFDTMMQTDAWTDKSREFSRLLESSEKILGIELRASAAGWPIKYKLRLLQVLTASSKG